MERAPGAVPDLLHEEGKLLSFPFQFLITHRIGIIPPWNHGNMGNPYELQIIQVNPF
jgi:hypothetical protein